jgi:hypothetical protein
VWLGLADVLADGHAVGEGLAAVEVPAGVVGVAVPVGLALGLGLGLAEGLALGLADGVGEPLLPRPFMMLAMALGRSEVTALGRSPRGSAAAVTQP